MTRILTIIIGVFLAAALLTAQTPANVTSIGVEQLRGTSSSTGLIYVVLPNQAVAYAEIGPGIVLDTSGARPVLRVVLPTTSRVEVDGEVPQRVATGSLAYTLAKLPNAGTLKVYMNGLRLRVGVDYTVTAQTVTFIPHYSGMLSGATLQADYITQ